MWAARLCEEEGHEGETVSRTGRQWIKGDSEKRREGAGGWEEQEAGRKEIDFQRQE